MREMRPQEGRGREKELGRDENVRSKKGAGRKKIEEEWRGAVNDSCDRGRVLSLRGEGGKVISLREEYEHLGKTIDTEEGIRASSPREAYDHQIEPSGVQGVGMIATVRAAGERHPGMGASRVVVLSFASGGDAFAHLLKNVKIYTSCKRLRLHAGRQEPRPEAEERGEENQQDRGMLCKVRDDAAQSGGEIWGREGDGMARARGRSAAIAPSGRPMGEECIERNRARGKGSDSPVGGEPVRLIRAEGSALLQLYFKFFVDLGGGRKGR